MSDDLIAPKRLGHGFCRLSRGLEWAQLAVLLGAMGCEPRPEAPRFEAPVGLSESTPPPPPVATATAPEPAAPWRCVVKTPEEPPPAAEPGPDPRCPEGPEQAPLRRGKVTFDAASVAISVELAESANDQERGLMYRRALGEGEGMLFVFGQRRVQAFWMKDTCIPLDLLFIDEDGLVVGIVENAKTMDESDLSVPCPSVYVLEVNAGWSRRHGVRSGMTVTIAL